MKSSQLAPDSEDLRVILGFGARDIAEFLLLASSDRTHHNHAELKLLQDNFFNPYLSVLNSDLVR